MDKKLYTYAALILAGYGAGELELVPEALATSTTRNVHVVKQVLTSNGTINAIIASAKAVLCPLIETKASMSEGTCKVRPGSLITIKVGDPADPESRHQATLEIPVKISEVADAVQ